MKDINNITKGFSREQFMEYIEKLENKIEELETINSNMEIDLQDAITESEIETGYKKELEEFKNKLDDFMFRLKQDKCYTKELEEFIRYYGRGWLD